MSAEQGAPGKSRRDLTDSARQRVSLAPAFRRILAGISGAISAAIAGMRSKASSSSFSAWAEAHVPPAWRRRRRLMLVGALLGAIAVIIPTWPRATPPPPPAPGTTVFQIGNRVVLRFVHSAGGVQGRAGPDDPVSSTK